MDKGEGAKGGADRGEARGEVYGRLVDNDGEPLADWRVTLTSLWIRGDEVVGETTTNHEGRFTIHYERPRALNLRLRAHHGDRHAESPTTFAAPATLELDFSTAPGGLPVALSSLTVLQRQARAQLHGTPLVELKENAERHEVHFLADAMGVSFTRVAQLYLAERMARAHETESATWFGLFDQGMPSQLAASLTTLPKDGLDRALERTTLLQILLHPRSALDAALTAARAANTLPASYARQQSHQLDRLDALRLTALANTPNVRGPIAFHALLAAGDIPKTTQDQFYRAYVSAGAQLDTVWTTLQSDGVSSALITQLQNTITAGDLLPESLPLIKDTLARIAAGTLASVDDLASLSETDWEARLRSVSTDAGSVTTLAQTLTARFAALFPSTALAASLKGAPTSSFQSHTQLVALLNAHPTIDLVQSDLDTELKGVQVATQVLADLKTMQRLARVATSFSAVNALHNAGFTSAQQIYSLGREAFVAKMAPTLGAAQAQATFAQANMTYAAALTTYARYNLALNGTPIAAMTSPAPDSTLLDGSPDLQALFGSQDYFSCSDCQSVLSPAAYLVDLLQYLNGFTATSPAGSGQAAFLARRPEVQYLALSCQNTEVTLPYIDLVNEVLEAAVNKTTYAAGTVLETAGTAEERRALPQSISLAAYTNLAGASFPLTLPFDWAFARGNAYLTALGTTRAQLLRLFDPPSTTTATTACAVLGVNPAMYTLLTTVTSSPWTLWGIATSATPTAWLNDLTDVPTLLNRSGITLPRLFQLFEVPWVTNGTVQLIFGQNAAGEVLPDIGSMVLTVGDQHVFTRANIFLRLWAATGLTMWELGWALGPVVPPPQPPLSPPLSPLYDMLSDSDLEFVVDAQAVAKRLALPLQEVLTFWRAIETVDVTNHLGDHDSIVPATYNKVFANPTMLKSWSTVFPAAPQLQTTPFDVSGTLDPSDPNSTAALAATSAALGISGDDIGAILSATGTGTTLNLATLRVLFCHARLAAALSVSVSDLLLWIALTGATPVTSVGGVPGATLEFIRRWELLRSTGLSAQDLDYILRNGSAANTTLAFTNAQSAALLTALQTALAKLTASQLADPTTVGTLLVASLAAACGVTADVITPIVSAMNLLPVTNATVTSLTTGTVATLGPTFTRVARGAALYTALKITPSEFAFIVANAAHFNWLDPSALPTTTVSPYTAFEALIRAVALEHRATSSTPKLFDVFGAWLTSTALPTTLQAAFAGTVSTAVNAPPPLDSLAAALAANVADAVAIATQLGAAPPSASVIAGTLTDIALLERIAAALDVCARYTIRGAALVALAAPEPSDSTSALAQAETAVGAFQARYGQSAWFAAVQPIEDGLRAQRRDALVAYLLGQPNVVSGASFTTVDDLYDYFLIDPEMGADALSTRLLQASLAIQQFVQQVTLSLSLAGNDVTAPAGVLAEWSWRQQYQLWRANREVFLYPENYLLPELRKDASPIFVDLESNLRQANCDVTLATDSLTTYLRGLVDISHLKIAAQVQQKTANAIILHVFAHTRGTPMKWYYRTRTTTLNSDHNPIAPGTWAAWQEVNLDIQTEHVIPAIWDGRLYLVWATFKLMSEKQSAQPIPQTTTGKPNSKTGASSTTTTPSSQPPPQNYWAVEFSFSELSAGSWQAKRLLDEKMYFMKNDKNDDKADRPPIAFTFRALETSLSELAIGVYYSPCESDTVEDIFPELAVPMAFGVLSSPDAPLLVIQDSDLLPDVSIVDLAHEPSRALVIEQFGLVTGLTYFPTPYVGAFIPQPQSFYCTAQYLRSNNYYEPNPGQVVANVISPLATGDCAPYPTVALLDTVNDPRLLVSAAPSNTVAFADPFFIIDGGAASIGATASTPRPARTYLVDDVTGRLALEAPRPMERIDGRTKETNEIASRGPRVYQFSTMYHPFARTFLRLIEVQDIEALLSRATQVNPQAARNWANNWQPFDFKTIFQPTKYVAQPYPGTATAPDVGESALDFAKGSSGAYSLYNWELFYHAPMFVASLLLQNQQFADALHWLSYIFNPSDTGIDPLGGATSIAAPQRYWQTAPFFAMNASQWTNQQINAVLQNLNTPDNQQALAIYLTDPFDPHAIAALRIGAYAKATFMKYLDVLIAWGDSLFSTYTSETVAQAEQLYVMADQLLGPRPVEVRAPAVSATATPTFATIHSSLDQFSDALVSVENVIIAPSPTAGTTAGTPTPPLPQMPLFCIPPNAQLLAYWDTIADRLYKIRHGLNLQGQPEPLPLYAPGINPLNAIEGGLDANGNGARPPIYRFATYLQKSLELTNDVRAFGALLLAALEKRDAEALAVLRATQEIDIQTRMVDIKTQQVTEATDQIAALQQQKAVYQTTANYYQTLVQSGLNEWETKALALQAAAMGLNQLAIPLDHAAGAAQLIPSFSGGIDGFGGSPSVTISFGGSNLAGGLSAIAGTLRGLAGLSQEAAGVASTMGSYQRRSADWNYQVSLATAQMAQVDAQITAANDRLTIAQKELDLQNAQLDNANAINNFLNQKYTNTQLYDWMAGQLTTVYTQAYQLALSLAQQTERAFQYELCSSSTFLQAGYWDSQHKGLLAGESLLFDLRRMESAYLAENLRELELTKTISLAITQPEALVTLLQTGTCAFMLDEALFDADHPGQYFRRLRSVAITVPCVTGPYVGVNADLTLLTEAVRYAAPAAGYTSQAGGVDPGDPATFRFSNNIGTTISTSTGQNDAGLFDVNLRDERWLPFEGEGAISSWQLSLKAGNNAFDLTTISDVLLHVRYSARPGSAIPAPPSSAPPAAVLLSVKSMFPDAFAALFNGSSATPSLTLPLLTTFLPYSSATPTLTALTLYVLSPGSKVTTAPVTITPTLGPPQPYTLAIDPTQWTGLTVTTETQTTLDPTKIEDLWLVLSYTLPTS